MLIHQKVPSKYLEIDTDLYIIRPNEIKEGPIYLLYLLHGYSGDYTNWVRYTRIEKYVDGKNMIVVMPSGMNMYYLNTATWYPYFSYLTKELPKIIEETYRLPIKKENTFIAGLSMGGYGALRAILSTNHYAKAAAFSGALDIRALTKEVPNLRKSAFETVFSKTIRLEDDLYHLATKQTKDIELYISCGVDDPFLVDSQQFVDVLKQHNIKHVYYEKPGSHTWDFWDQEIQSALKFFLNE